MRTRRRIPRQAHDPWAKILTVVGVATGVLFAVINMNYTVIGPASVFDVNELMEGGPELPGGRFLITAVDQSRVGPATLIRAKSDDVMDEAARVEEEVRAAGEAAMEEAVRNALQASASYLGTDPRVELMPLEGVLGGSGGLMMALAVVDAHLPQDLTRGRVIAGSGTISPTGLVGEVLGLRYKVAAAERAGAEIFLVPTGQIPEAHASADRVEVIGVSTLAEAVAALS